MARFCDSGSVPDDSDALHIWHSTGARTTVAFFTNHVGTGSRSQCFGGTFLSIAMISSVVTAWKADKLDVARTSTSATGAFAVAARIPFTLAVKWLTNSSAVDDSVTTVGCGFNSAFTCDHNARVSCLFSVKNSVQYDWKRDWNTILWCANCWRQAESDSSVVVCRWILSWWRVLIFCNWHSALYQWADEETAQMLVTLSGACSSTATLS